jgi:hypothetical protein
MLTSRVRSSARAEITFGFLQFLGLYCAWLHANRLASRLLSHCLLAAGRPAANPEADGSKLASAAEYAVKWPQAMQGLFDRMVRPPLITNPSPAPITSP